jgi:hypothetical protein
MFHVLQVLVPTKRMFTFTYICIGVSITKRNVSVWQNKKTNVKSLSDILIKLKTEFNAIGSGNWEGINFNCRSFQISMFYRTFGPIYILKSSVLLHFCRSGPTVFGKSVVFPFQFHDPLYYAFRETWFSLC